MFKTYEMLQLTLKIEKRNENETRVDVKEVI
jgi:hypothetical protein